MDFKKYIPHASILVLFVVVTIAYFFPLYQGKTVRSHDIVQYQGMAKEIIDNRQKFGEEPFWTSAMFGGMPNTMVNMEHSGNLFKPLHGLIISITKYPSSLIFISLVSFFLLMLAFDSSVILATIGAVGFAFASFNFISLQAGHNAKIACIAYMPAVLAGLVWSYRKNKWMGAAILAIALALQITNNHVQITYYLAFICLGYGIVEFYNALVAKKLNVFFQTTLILMVVALVALGTNAGYFLSLNEYGKYSIRGKTELKPLEENKEAVRADGLDRDYVFNYSNSLTEPFTFLIPDYMGGASSGSLDTKSAAAAAMQKNGVDYQQMQGFLQQVPLYFGEQPYVAGPIYIGAIICFLFILGLIIVKDRIKWMLLACSVIGILLTFGKNLPALNYLLFDYFPLYNKFRSVTMAVVIPQVCMSILAVLALKTIFETKDKTIFSKPLAIAAGTTAGFSIMAFLMASTGSYSSAVDQAYQLPEWLIEALEEDRKGMRTGDALRSFFFISLVGGTIYLLIINKIKQNLAGIAILIFTFFDLWIVDKRYLNSNSFDKNVIKEFYAPTEADALVLQDTDPNFRVFNLDNPFNDARTSYFHKSVGGYSPAKLRRYQDLIERKISIEQQLFIDGLKKREVNFHLTPVLNMLNTKYVLAGNEAQGVIKNDSAYGNAWYVKDIETVNNADEEIAELGLHDPRHTAVMDVSRFKQDQVHFLKDTAAYVKLTAFKPYELVYECSSKYEGFIVFSEVFYPKGWTATIDEKPTTIKQVNYVLRGLHVQPGKHSITMKMSNESYLLGNKIALGCSGLIYLGFVLVLYTTFKGNKK